MICGLSNCECIATATAVVSSIIAIAGVISNSKKISENQKIALMDKRIPPLESLIKKYKELFILCDGIKPEDIATDFRGKFEKEYDKLIAESEKDILSSLILGNNILTILNKIDVAAKNIYGLLSEKNDNSSFDTNAVFQKINNINALKKDFVTEVSNVFLVDKRIYSEKFKDFLNDEFLKNIGRALS